MHDLCISFLVALFYPPSRLVYDISCTPIRVSYMYVDCRIIVVRRVSFCFVGQCLAPQKINRSRLSVTTEPINRVIYRVTRIRSCSDR